jgi:hypothetical protein
MLSLVINTKNEFEFFVDNILKLIILFAFLISTLTLLNLFDVINFSEYFFTNDISGNYPNYTDAIDYNFALLPVIFGIICIFYQVPKATSKYQKIGFILLLMIFSLDIFLSGSKRGLAITGLIFFVLLTAKVLSFYTDNVSVKKISLNLKYVIISFFMIMTFSWIFVYYASSDLKSRTLDLIGSKNKLTARIKVASNVMRYVSVFNKKIIYPELYEKIWSIRLFDPIDPISGWGVRVHKIVYPLEGKNVEIVPKDSKGYLMDSTCNANTWDGNAFSYTIFGTREIAEGCSGRASVYCFVSDDFDGTWALLALVGKNGAFIQSDQYDLNKKNEWQKLEIEVADDKNNSGLSLYFSKFGVTDFHSLKGYIIFAYPKFEIIGKDGKIITPPYPQNSVFKNTFLKIRNYDTHPTKLNTYSLNISMVSGKSNDEDGITLKSDKSIKHHYNYSSFFSGGDLETAVADLSLSKDSSSILQDKDPIRNWVARFISEDTTYHPFKSLITINKNSDNFIDLRFTRWQFAWQLFTSEYSLKKKLFGGGFDFLNWYGYYFMNDKKTSDWPHNPFLSILLYSGLFGLILYCILIYRVFYLYLKYVKRYPLLFIFFLISFFFSFFSGSSPFDPPIMGFFIILPFFIHSIHKREKTDIGLKTSE